MKRIIVTLFCFITVATTFAQTTFPNNPSPISNASTLVSYAGGLTSNGYKIKRFTDTLEANAQPYLKYTPNLMIKCGEVVYVRNNDVTAWINIATGGSGDITNNIYVLVDSSINVVNNYVDSTQNIIYNYVDSSILVNNYYTSVNSSSTILLSGSIIWDSAFSFHNTALTYLILGAQYSAGQSGFTIAGSDSVYDRYSIVYADTLGHVGVINGTYTLPASIPSVDPKSQILLATYFIPHLSTSPQGISNVVIYKENVAPEFTISGTVTGLNPDYLTNPYAGLKSTRIPQIINGQTFDWYSPTIKTPSDYAYLSFYIRLGATLSKTTKIVLSFQNNTSAVSTTLALANGVNGFSSSLVGAWQLVVMPMSGWTFSNPDFNKLHIALTGSNASGFQLDNVILQSGGVVPTAQLVTSVFKRTGNVVAQPTDYPYYVATSRLNYNSQSIIHYNINGVAIDSFQFTSGPDTTMYNINSLTVKRKEVTGSRYDSVEIRTRFIDSILIARAKPGIGMSITDSIGADGLHYPVFNSTGSSGISGNDDSAYHSSSLNADTTGFRLYRSAGPYDEIVFDGNAGGGGGSGISSVVAGTNITVDNTDPLNPIINATGDSSTPDTILVDNRYATVTVLAPHKDTLNFNKLADTLALINAQALANYNAIQQRVNFSDTAAMLNPYQHKINLTTVGSSGASTFNQATGALNIPSYAGGGGGSSGNINDSIAKGFLISDSGTVNTGLTPLNMTWGKVHQQRFFTTIDDNFINYKSSYEAEVVFEDTVLSGSTPYVTPLLTGSALIVKGSSIMKVRTGPQAAWTTIEASILNMSSQGTFNGIGPALIMDSLNYIAGIYDAVSQKAYIRLNGVDVLTKSVNLDSSFIKIQLMITGTSVSMWAESNSNKFFIGSYNNDLLGYQIDSTLKKYKYGIYSKNIGGISTNSVTMLRGGVSGGGGLLNVRLVTNEDGSTYTFSNKVLFTADLEASPNSAGFTNGNSTVFSLDMSTFQVETVGKFYMKRNDGGAEVRVLGSTNIKLVWYASKKKWLFIYDQFDWQPLVNTYNDMYAWLDYEAPFGQTVLDGSQLQPFGFNTTTYPGWLYDVSVKKINNVYYVLGAYKNPGEIFSTPILFSGADLSTLTTVKRYNTTTFLECGTFLKIQGTWYINYYGFQDTKSYLFNMNLDSLGFLNLPYAVSPGISGIPGYEWLYYQKNGKTNYYLVGFDSKNLSLSGSEAPWTRGNLVVFKAKEESVGYEFPNRIANQITFPTKDLNIPKFGKFPVFGRDNYLTNTAQNFAGQKTFLNAAIFSNFATFNSNVTFNNPIAFNAGISLPSSLSNSNLKVGALEFQSYAVNNAWFGDNTYFDGSAFVRRAAGFSGLFYFAGAEGQLRFGANAAASSTVTQLIPFKANLDGTVALGGNMSNAAGTYTGATMIVNSNFAQSKQYRLSALNTAPLTATDTGTTGEIRVTSGYIYVCTATNTWVRTALSTF